MLLFKKLLHLLFLFRNQQNIKKRVIHLLFYNKKQKLIFRIVGLYFFTIALKKKLIPFFIYLFELQLPNLILFNRILFRFFEILNIFCLKLNFRFSYLNSLKKKYTMLRSPFIYKKSREQYFIEHLKGFIFWKIGFKNVIFIECLDFFLKKIFGLSNFFLLHIKKIISLKNET